MDGQRRKDKIYDAWVNMSHVPALVLIVLVLWAVGYSLFGEDIVGVHSQLFSLVVLFISAKCVGYIFGKIHLPPMIGMLLMGFLLRNIDFLQIEGNYRRFTTVLRQLALVNIMLPAGLGLDAKALRKLIWMILNLATIPVAAEVAALTLTAYYLLDLPVIWAALLGLLLAAVSPAVIIPCLFQLQDGGYGVNKGIHTLVIAASTFNDIICIALFGIVIGVIFSTGSVLMQALHGPIVIAMGLSYGVLWGMVCSYVPHAKHEFVVTLRTLLLGTGCVLSALGSDAIGYGGAGALGCIVAAFVASLRWRSEGWDNNNPVRMNFILAWKFFEPISFGLIGMEINFSILDGDTVLYGTIAMTIALLLRLIVSFACTQFANFNVKEHIFVAICWIPKATVQAALGPVALDLARNHPDPEMTTYANIVVVVAVISILITSPIGAILIMQLGPRFLHRSERSILDGITSGEQVTAT